MAIDAGHPSLPDDIVVDIFARLPSKSVGRCRCLSRAWAATLSSDDFVDRHRRLANRRGSPSVLFLHYSFHDGPLMHLWSQDRPGGGASSCVDVRRAANGIPLRRGGGADDVPRPMGIGVLRLATLQCRGLVVLQDSEISYLCNPSTGQMAALPQGRKVWRHEHEDVLTRHYASLGLGYDARTRSHKAVRVYYGGCDLQAGLPWSAGCEVYVVGSAGRRWRTVAEKPPAWVRYHTPSVFAQGNVHWLAHRKVDVSDRPVEMVILSFSIADHRFGTVAPPPGMESESLSKHELTELDGHLCLFSYSDVSRSSCYDIWLLLSEHGAHVWDLRYRIDMSKVSPDIADRFVRCRLYPLAIISNGSRVLLVQPRMACAFNYSRLCAYDPVTGDVEDIFSGSSMVHHSFMCSIDAAVYEESIISFG